MMLSWMLCLYFYASPLWNKIDMVAELMCIWASERYIKKPQTVLLTAIEEKK